MNWELFKSGESYTLWTENRSIKSWSYYPTEEEIETAIRMWAVRSR